MDRVYYKSIGHVTSQMHDTYYVSPDQEGVDPSLIRIVPVMISSSGQIKESEPVRIVRGKHELSIELKVNSSLPEA